MTEIEYVRSQAQHDSETRAEAIKALRALEAEHAILSRKNDELRACVVSLLALTSGRTWLIAERETIARAEALLGVSSDSARRAMVRSFVEQVSTS